MNAVSSVCERSAVAAPDISSGRLVVDKVVASLASHGVTADGALSGHLQRSGRVVAPDIVDVVGPVVGETAGVEGGVAVGREDSDNGTTAAGHALLSPWVSVLSGLSTEVAANGVNTTGSKTTGSLGRTIVILELHTQNKANEINIRNISVDSTASVHVQLNEAPVDVSGRV